MLPNLTAWCIPLLPGIRTLALAGQVLALLTLLGHSGKFSLAGTTVLESLMVVIRCFSNVPSDVLKDSTSTYSNCSETWVTASLGTLELHLVIHSRIHSRNLIQY